MRLKKLPKLQVAGEDRKFKNTCEDKAELALMGKFVSIESKEECDYITRYILKVMGTDRNYPADFSITKRINSACEVKYLGTNVLYGEFKCITYCLDYPETPKPFETDYGSGYPSSFCYVFNTNADDCSEYGDCFFEEKEDGFYHRVS